MSDLSTRSHSQRPCMAACISVSRPPRIQNEYVKYMCRMQLTMQSASLEYYTCLPVRALTWRLIPVLPCTEYYR